MIVEPNAGDRVEDNLNPVGRAYYGVLDAAVHARVAVAGGRARARRAGRRGADPRRRARPAASRASAARPRRRSTWCSKRGRDASASRSAPASRASSRAPAREQTRARYPDERGLRRARRRADLLGGLRRRRADRPAAADLVDRPLAPLEGADPLPRAPLPRRHVRRARQRPLGPAGGRRGVQRRRVRRRRARGPGRHRRPSARRSSGSRAARCGRLSSPPTTRSASTASRSSARRCALAPGHPDRERSRVRRASSTPTRAGRSTTATTGVERLPRLPRVLLRADASPSRTRPSRSRTASAGALETTPETLARHDARRSACRAARALRETCCAACAVPSLVIHGDRRPRSARSRRARRSPRPPAAQLVTLEGAGHCRTARDPVQVNLLLRDFVVPRRAPPRALDAGRRLAPQARAVRLLADRARPRAARRRDRRRAAPAASRTSRSTGSRSTRSRACSRTRGERIHPASAELASESAPHRVARRPSTTCTCSRRCGGWTRSSSRTSWSSTTSCATSSTTCGSATRRGRSTTSCTRTPS